MNNIYEIFRLNGNPFKMRVDPSLLVGYERERNEIKGFIEREGRICLILGQTGVGKTTLMKWVESNMKGNRNYITLYLPKPPRNEDSLLEIFLHNIVKRSVFDVIFRRRIILHDLHEYIRRRCKKRILLLIDEIHETGDEVLQWLKSLVDHVDMQLIIAGLPEFYEKIERTFLERVDPVITLRNLTRDEVMQLILKRIESAGGSGISPFTEEAIDEIYSVTNGVPREVIRICDKALYQAAAERRNIISRDFIQRIVTCNVNVKEVNVTKREETFDISSLPAKQRKIVEILMEEDDLSPSEIAEKIGFDDYSNPENAVKSINNILRRLVEEGIVVRKYQGNRYIYRLHDRIKEKLKISTQK